MAIENLCHLHVLGAMVHAASEQGVDRKLESAVGSLAARMSKTIRRSAIVSMWLPMQQILHTYMSLWYQYSCGSLFVAREALPRVCFRHAYFHVIPACVALACSAFTNFAGWWAKSDTSLSAKSMWKRPSAVLPTTQGYPYLLISM